MAKSPDLSPYSDSWYDRDLLWFYKVARTGVSDIHEHIQVLWMLARGCGHVTEFGTRDGVSTTAFLHARPRRLVSYDLDYCLGARRRLERLAGPVNFTFQQADVRQVVIEPTDLLFIDTHHVYEQLKEELRLHADKVSRYIVLHDTEAYGEQGGGEQGFEPGRRGLKAALQEFLAEGTFRVKHHFPDCNGLTVLERIIPRDPVTAPPYRQEPAHPRRTKVIARCTPTLGLVHCWWVQAAEGLLWPFNSGQTMLFAKDFTGGEIAECRNQLVQTVLEAEAPEREMSHIFWLDDDVIAMRGAMLQLLGHNRDIASGVYFGKTPGTGAEPLVFDAPCAGSAPFTPDIQRESWGHGMGLTLVRTEVYRRMRDELDLPPDAKGNPEWYRTLGRAEDLEFKGDVAMTAATEDLYFLHRAGKMGYRPFVDMTKHAFGFHLDPRTERGYPEEQWRQFYDGTAIVWKGLGPNGSDVVWD